MNNNIFSPKGKIDQSMFVIYYILLVSIYFLIGFVGFPLIIKHKLPLFYANIVIFVLNILILFNYKKRIMDFTEKLWLSVTLATILTFDHLLIPFIFVNPEYKFLDILFYILIITAFVVQPAIITLFPSKK